MSKTTEQFAAILIFVMVYSICVAAAVWFGLNTTGPFMLIFVPLFLIWVFYANAKEGKVEKNQNWLSLKWSWLQGAALSLIVVLPYNLSTLIQAF